jgi:hypothetical protein
VKNQSPWIFDVNESIKRFDDKIDDLELMAFIRQFGFFVTFRIIKKHDIPMIGINAFRGKYDAV